MKQQFKEDRFWLFNDKEIIKPAFCNYYYYFTGCGANITSTFKTKHTDFKRQHTTIYRQTPLNLCRKHIQCKAMSGVRCHMASMQEILRPIISSLHNQDLCVWRLVTFTCLGLLSSTFLNPFQWQLFFAIYVTLRSHHNIVILSYFIASVSDIANNH